PPRFVALHDGCWPSVIWMGQVNVGTIRAVALPRFVGIGVYMNMTRPSSNDRSGFSLRHLSNLLSNSASGSSPNSSESKPCESPSPLISHSQQPPQAPHVWHISSAL